MRQNNRMSRMRFACPEGQGHPVSQSLAKSKIVCPLGKANSEWSTRALKLRGGQHRTSHSCFVQRKNIVPRGPCERQEEPNFPSVEETAKTGNVGQQSTQRSLNSAIDFQSVCKMSLSLFNKRYLWPWRQRYVLELPLRSQNPRSLTKAKTVTRTMEENLRARKTKTKLTANTRIARRHEPGVKKPGGSNPGGTLRLRKPIPGGERKKISRRPSYVYHELETPTHRRQGRPTNHRVPPQPRARYRGCPG